MGLLLLYVGGALAISFLCSVLEAALLSTPTYELLARKEKGDRAAARLHQLKEERVDDAISAILTLNTIAHTIGATMAGAQAAIVFGDEMVGVFSGVLTFLVLVLTEIIPKTIGTVYASRLVPFVSVTLRLLVAALAPILAVSRALTGLLTKGHHRKVSRGDVRAIVGMAVKAGTLGGKESEVLSNVLHLEQIQVEDVMTPRTVACMAPVDGTAGDLVNDTRLAEFSRVPLHGANRDEVLGYVLCREVTTAAAAEGSLDLPLRRFLHEVHVLPETSSLRSALDQMLQRKEGLTIVVDEFGGVSGIVTMEDILETILGTEIMDETDRVADLRKSAAELRDRRLRRRGGDSD